MRQAGLILENLDGFDDLANKFVMRGVPHTLAMRTSLNPAAFDGTTNPPTERTGWSGDGSPGSGTLREFAIGAVTQHFTKTLNRVPGVDFRLPTPHELDAMEAFQRFLGRNEDPDLGKLKPKLKNVVVRKGLEIFINSDPAKGPAGKCAQCHENAGASISAGPNGSKVNANFATGVEALADIPADLIDPQRNPPDGGFGREKVNGVPGFGNGTFNTPPLVEAADTPPFFHNNAVSTIEGAVAFFNSDAFNKSPSGQFLGGIRLEPAHIEAIAAFLRVLNALENIRASLELKNFVLDARAGDQTEKALLKIALAEQEDVIEVLEPAGLHPGAVEHMRRAMHHTRLASASSGGFQRNAYVRQAIQDVHLAKRDLVSD
jgi:hypothetical protein